MEKIKIVSVKPSCYGKRFNNVTAFVRGNLITATLAKELMQGVKESGIYEAKIYARDWRVGIEHIKTSNSFCAPTKVKTRGKGNK